MDWFYSGFENILANPLLAIFVLFIIPVALVLIIGFILSGKKI